MVERLFLAVPLGCLWFVIVVFPDHTHLLSLFFGNLLEFALWKASADNPPILSQGFGPFAENGFRAIQRAK